MPATTAGTTSSSSAPPSRRRATRQCCRARSRASVRCGPERLPGRLALARRRAVRDRHLVYGKARMRLEDTVAIITGAGQGIGEAYARRFAKEGARVVVADVNAEKGAAVARDIGQVFERVDVSSEDDTKRLCRAVAERFGRIDVLINNAAIFFGIDNQNTSYAYLRKIFDVNYFGAWLMCRAVFPHMREGGGGSII